MINTKYRAFQRSTSSVKCPVVSLTALLLLVVSISCKEEFIPLHYGVDKAEFLHRFNTEEPGTDCEVRTQTQRKIKRKAANIYKPFAYFPLV